MAVIRKLFRFAVDTAVVLAVIIYLPGLPPYGNFDAHTIAPQIPLDGALSPKGYVLNEIEKLYQDELVGPECLEASPVEPGVFYSTLQGGVIVKFTENGNKMVPVGKFGGKCDGLWDAQACGRPLGIRFNKEGHLITADAYLGIFKTDFKLGETKTLVPKGTEVDGKTTKIFNSVVPASDGLIYYTDSSTNYYLHEAVGELFGSPSGRLMVYDPVKNESKVLRDKIHFANGIVLSVDEDYLVFSECLQYRLLKYWLKGPKAGTTEIFIEGLPGTPDNLAFSPGGNIFVSLVTVRLPGKMNPLDVFYQMPLARKLLLRIIHVLKAPFDMIDTYLNLPFARQIAFHMLNFETALPFTHTNGIILEVDWSGKVVDSWHSSDRSIGSFSEVIIMDGSMYFASPYNKYLGRLKLDTDDQPLLTLG